MCPVYHAQQRIYVLPSARQPRSRPRLKARPLEKMIYILLVEKPLMRPADVLIALTEYESLFRALGLKNKLRIIQWDRPRVGSCADAPDK
jgi:hypothetical protein